MMFLFAYVASFTGGWPFRLIYLTEAAFVIAAIASIVLAIRLRSIGTTPITRNVIALIGGVSMSFGLLMPIELAPFFFGVSGEIMMATMAINVLYPIAAVPFFFLFRRIIGQPRGDAVPAPPRDMKRFVIYVALVVVFGALSSAILMVMTLSPNPIGTMLRLPGLLLIGCFSWLFPALAIATADQLIRSDASWRLVKVATVACLSVLLLGPTFYNFPAKGSGWGFGHLVPCLIGAVVAIISGLLVGQLNDERSMIRLKMDTLRRWPNPVEE